MGDQSILTRLGALDDHYLAEIVRQDQYCPDFVMTSWQVDRLSDKGMANPDGLFRFRGTGYDPARPDEPQSWTVVLKILNVPSTESNEDSIWYWKRELLAFQSGLLENLPEGGVKAPRFYGIKEQGETVWMWMEYIQEIDPPRWPLHRFPTAARSLGRLNGAYLSESPLPEYPWLSRDQGITWASNSLGEDLLQLPSVQTGVSAENWERLQHLWAERERFFYVYRGLPQVFSHCDSGRRNQLFRVNAEGIEEMVSIDWAWCGIAPLGWDLSMLLVDSTLILELDAEKLPDVEKASFPAYMEGLHTKGWHGDSRLVRLGFCVSATLFPLFPFPKGLAHWSKEEMRSVFLQTYGRTFEEAVPDWRSLFEYLLTLGEEALSLMDDVPLGRANAS